LFASLGKYLGGNKFKQKDDIGWSLQRSGTQSVSFQEKGY